MLVVHTNRLARIIDRTRVLEVPTDVELSPKLRAELEALHKRGHLINCAITLSTVCGLFICIVIAMLFLGDAVSLPLNEYIAAFFILSMASLIGSLVYFLREVLIGSHYMRTQQLKSLNRSCLN
jgi:hypothetical protein